MRCTVGQYAVPEEYGLQAETVVFKSMACRNAMVEQQPSPGSCVEVRAGAVLMSHPVHASLLTVPQEPRRLFPARPGAEEGGAAGCRRC